jgi:para-aminobenzoate synthetase component 1
VIDYIRAGDVFQVNLARRFRTECPLAPIALYQRLCETNPAGFAAYVSICEGGHRLLAGATRAGATLGHFSDAAVVSSSPELFLQVRGRDAATRPIKGTRARGRVEREDAALRAELAASVKDRAELAMIIDLERNDLGRVCEYGSVRVASDGEIEALPTVYHRTATVTGRLRDGCDAIDLLRAAFPGGSITGAPKVRAMQIINELEDFARGPYCGAMGWIGVNGDMMLNLAIRTMTVADRRIDLFVGSGIVADSDPELELAELEAKAAGMMAALKGQITGKSKRQDQPRREAYDSVLGGRGG